MIRCWMNLLGSQAEELRNDVELLEGAAHPFDLDAYLAGRQTPVFFGSAIKHLWGAATAGYLCAACPPSPSPCHHHPAGLSPLKSHSPALSFKDSGKHGPGPPRPDRLFQDLLRSI